MSHNANKDLQNAIQELIKDGRTKFSDREFMFVFPIVGQVVAANRSIDILTEANESACLGANVRK